MIGALAQIALAPQPHDWHVVEWQERKRLEMIANRNRKALAAFDRRTGSRRP